MFIYYILIVLLIGFATFENNKNQNRLTFISFLLLLFLFSFRSYLVGSDTSRYIQEYLYQTSDLRNIDYGFVKYNEIIYKYGLSARQYLIVTSFFICFPVFLYIRYVSDKKILTYILYITIGNFVINLSGIRQSLAISIILTGYLITLLFSKKWIKYIIILLFIYLASLFHASAQFCIILVPMLWASYKQFTISKLFLVIFTITPLILIPTGFFEYTVSEFNTISRYQDFEADSSHINIIAYFVIPYIIFIYLSFILYFSKHTSLSPKDNFAYLCAFMFLVSAFASSYIPIISRMQYYFSIQMLSLIPTLTNKMPRSFRNIIQVLIVVICSLYFIISQTGGIMRIDNYMFSFE